MIKELNSVEIETVSGGSVNVSKPLRIEQSGSLSLFGKKITVPLLSGPLTIPSFATTFNKISTNIYNTSAGIYNNFTNLSK